MTNLMRNSLTKSFNNTMKNIDRLLNDLNSDSDAKEVLNKILSMDEQFLFNNLNSIIPGFSTPESTEKSLNILVNILLDDTELFIEHIVINQEILEKVKNNPILKDKIKPQFKETVNTCGQGTEISGSDLMSFIDRCEAKEIKNINLSFNLSLRNNPKDSALQHILCFKDVAYTFSEENFNMLELEVKEFFSSLQK